MRWRPWRREVTGSDARTRCGVHPCKRQTRPLASSGRTVRRTHTRARAHTHTHRRTQHLYGPAWPASKPLSGIWEELQPQEKAWRNRSRRGERRRSDGKATTLRSSRADLAAFRACHAFGTSMRRWVCAGRSYPSHSTSRSPPTWWERGARREQVSPIQLQAGVVSRIGMGLLCAQHVLATSGIFGS